MNCAISDDCGWNSTLFAYITCEFPYSLSAFDSISTNNARPLVSQPNDGWVNYSLLSLLSRCWRDIHVARGLSLTIQYVIYFRFCGLQSTCHSSPNAPVRRRHCGLYGTVRERDQSHALTTDCGRAAGQSLGVYDFLNALFNTTTDRAIHLQRQQNRSISKLNAVAIKITNNATWLSTGGVLSEAV